MGFFEWILILFVLAMVNFFIAVSSLKRFLADNPRMDSLANMNNLKDMVRKQMYQALLQIVFVGGMGILSVAGILTGSLSFTQFIIVLVLDGIVWAAGKSARSTERRAQNLPVSGEDLKVEYSAVCKTWTRKPFPDF